MICYLLAQAFKLPSFANKWLPTLCGADGRRRAVWQTCTMPEFPAGDGITRAGGGAL